VRIWRLIEDACSLEDVRDVAHDAVADFDGALRRQLPQR
jgi:hypothetical protein